MSRWAEAARANHRRTRARQHAILEWAQRQPGLFNAIDVAEEFNLSLRATYRYMASLRPWLKSQVGYGYVARKEMQL